MARETQRFLPLALLAMLLLLGAALAQDNAAPPAQAPAQDSTAAAAPEPGKSNRMLDQLNLGDAQKSQIQSIRQSAREQIQSVQQNTSLTPEQKTKQMREIRRNTHKQIHGVLTPEQRAELKQLRRQHRGHRGPGTA